MHSFLIIPTTLRLTLSDEPAGANPLYDVHTDEGEKHQGNGQLSEMVEPVSSVHLHLQYNRLQQKKHNGNSIVENN